MIKLFLVIQWKRTGKYLDNENCMIKCPLAVIIMPKRDKEQRQMNYEECIELARPRIGKYCKACKECNGKACGNQIPGPVDTSLELFGKKFRYPFFAGPVEAYISKIVGELEDTMKMCGVSDLAEITGECIWKNLYVWEQVKGKRNVSD